MLTICPTPIGNLDDATPRQIEALSKADVIACEDTRRTGKLLQLLGIERSEGRPRLERYDDHTASEKTDELVRRVQEGRQVVLVADAGTPTISDPGYRLVRACRRRRLEVTALPGPTAAVVALSGAGLPTDRFVFEGFLPTKTAQREKRLGELDSMGITAVVYVSPHRVEQVLTDVQTALGADREVCVARELTKMHEEYLTGPIGEVLERLEERMPLQGELVVCIGPPPREEPGEDERWAKADRLIEAMQKHEVSSRTIKEVVDEVCDVPRSELYDRIQKLSGG